MTDKIGFEQYKALVKELFPNINVDLLKHPILIASNIAMVSITALTIIRESSSQADFVAKT